MGKQCSIYKKIFSDNCMRICPHPKAKEKYGEEPWMSVMVCRRCKHGQMFKWIGAVKCVYPDIREELPRLEQRSI